MTTAPPGSPPKPPRKRGFAALDARARSLISASGGRAAHAQGVAHRFDSAEGRSAADTRYRKLKEASDVKASLTDADADTDAPTDKAADGSD
ncbi:hypothetical protein RBI22_04065 [Alcaligenaceae bacterium C4P045]|nr:hypothetical protein [Alcaligenaceae bacterium B3P038]MDQ2147872.1 hypothetical protein [Alcaligenaceae bacterium C4P045]